MLHKVRQANEGWREKQGCSVFTQPFFMGLGFLISFREWNLGLPLQSYALAPHLKKDQGSRP